VHGGPSRDERARHLEPEPTIRARDDALASIERARGERVERRVDARVGEKMSIAVMRESDRSKERRHPSRRVGE